MYRIAGLRFSLLTVLALSLVAVAAVACAKNAASDISGQDSPQDLSTGVFPTGTSAAGASIASRQRPAGEGSFGSTGAVPTAAPAPTTVTSFDFGDSDLNEDGSSSPSEASALDLQIQQISNERVIVRTVDMSIEAQNTAAAVQEIGNLATQLGGWVVRTQNVEVHRGAVEIRVPSDQLDSVIQQIKQIADNVVSEVSTSQDFTEEFTDTTARIQTMQDTVDALRALFQRAEDIDDALSIQREITRIQSDIEAMQARVNFLSQSAAFSLVRITVLALPQEIEINAGPDILAAVGRTVRLRAEFTPPEGIENFSISWDFGDGSLPRTVTTVAPVNVDGRVISAPVTHTYGDDTDSPYIVKVMVSGTGESGAAEGEDIKVITVNRVPPIEVFAGNNITADSGEEVRLRGSFTRPEGVTDLTYTWDFGDGSAPVTVNASTDATTAEIDHIYANSRPQGYDVVLTVEGETPSGSTEGSDELHVRVEDPESLNASGFSPGDSSRDAVRTLSSIGSGIGTVLIWVGILSPVWLTVAAVAFVIYRRQNRVNNRRTSESLATESRQGATD